MYNTPEKDAVRAAVIASIAAAFDGVGRGNGITLPQSICRFLRFFVEYDPERYYSDIHEAQVALDRGRGDYCQSCAENG